LVLGFGFEKGAMSEAVGCKIVTDQDRQAQILIDITGGGIRGMDDSRGLLVGAVVLMVLAGMAVVQFAVSVLFVIVVGVFLLVVKLLIYVLSSGLQPHGPTWAKVLIWIVLWAALVDYILFLYFEFGGRIYHPILYFIPICAAFGLMLRGTSLWPRLKAFRVLATIFFIVPGLMLAFASVLVICFNMTRSSQDTAVHPFTQTNSSPIRSRSRVQAPQRSVLVDDSQLAAEVKTRILSGAQLQDPTVQVLAKRGVVTLTGTVPNETVRDSAIVVAKQTAGVSKVQDQLTVDQLTPSPQPEASVNPTGQWHHFSEAPSLQGNSTLACGLGLEWSEEEGGLSSTWTRRGATDVFEAVYPAPGVKTVNTVTVSGGKVYITRTSGTDGNRCSYEGTVSADGKNIAGTYRCRNGSAQWKATMICDPVPGVRHFTWTYARNPPAKQQ
jgi:hypothetical protein